MNVIANREATVESARLQSVVGSLEQDYFKLSKQVTPDMAAAAGLGKSGHTSFVRRSSEVASNATPGGI